MKSCKKILLVLCVWAMSHVVCFSAAYAEDSENFKFYITPYAWLTSLSGTIGAEGHSTHVDAPFSSLTKHLNFAGMLALDVIAYDKVGFTGNVNVAMLGDHTSARGVSLDSKSSMVLSDLALFYRLGSTPLNDSGSVYAVWDILGGVRIWDLKAKLDVHADNRKLKASQREIWADPIIGLKSWVHFSEDWSLEFRGDIGGFDTNSKMTWGASSILAYSLWGANKLLLGYRAVGVDYEKGSGSDKFQADIIMHGPIIGLSFRF